MISCSSFVMKRQFNYDRLGFFSFVEKYYQLSSSTCTNCGSHVGNFTRLFARSFSI